MALQGKMLKKLMNHIIGGYSSTFLVIFLTFGQYETNERDESLFLLNWRNESPHVISNNVAFW